MDEQMLNRIAEELHPLEVKMLRTFQWVDSICDEDLIGKYSFDSARLDMAVGWLTGKNLIAAESEEKQVVISLTETGEEYADKKIPEIQILNIVKSHEMISIEELLGNFNMEKTVVNTAIGNLKEAGVISIGKGGRLIQSANYDIGRFTAVQDLILFMKEKGSIMYSELADNAKKIVDGMHRKRGKERGIFRVTEKIKRRYSLTSDGRVVFKLLSQKRPKEDELTQLTPDMLKTGSWKGKEFRKYNISLRPSRSNIGKKHPYMEFLDSVKYKLVALGFEEMRGPLIENEFWDMDVLYMPQFHPARNIHDVYYVKEPVNSGEISEPYLSNVENTHQNGWKTGSKGWGYIFDKERARRLILRSQGTAVSARKLASNPKKPGKYFGVARCFRYEQTDATHATDFFQIEGIVISDNINFSSLLGLLSLFAKEVAKADDLKFLPAYFPFTEPSVELHIRHPKLGWMELGGAGILRPEVTVPMGINSPVIAWGLGLDRMAMVALGIHDIRDLFSRDLEFIKNKRFTL